MSCKSALYGANTNTQTVPANGTISFGNVVRRFGNNLNLNGGNVTATGAGYYDIDTNFNFTAAAGTVTITLYKDGAAIPGATASVTTVAATNYAVSIPAIIRNICCAETTITAVVTGIEAVFTNASVAVEKI